jgi:6-phosphogluconolactonase
LAIPDAQIHRLRGEDPPEIAAAAAEKELRSLAPLSVHGQPVFDLLFLGLGEDGHVASLFPGESETNIASPAVFRAVTAVKPPPRRLTLGYPAIGAGRQVWVLASGAGKEGALRNSLAPNGATPLARVLKLRSQTKIFTDISI